MNQRTATDPTATTCAECGGDEPFVDGRCPKCRCGVTVPRFAPTGLTYGDTRDEACAKAAEFTREEEAAAIAIRVSVKHELRESLRTGVGRGTKLDGRKLRAIRRLLEAVA